LKQPICDQLAEYGIGARKRRSFFCHSVGSNLSVCIGSAMAVTYYLPNARYYQSGKDTVFIEFFRFGYFPSCQAMWNSYALTYS
jgi:hypothetical protein